MEYCIAGCAGGFCEYLVGHPLDTLKVRMQAMNHQSIAQAGRHIMKQHGPLGFFRGLPPSLASAVIRNGTLFGTYGNVFESLPVNGIFGASIAGSIAGMISTIVFQPTDLIKIRLQTESRGNTLSIVKKIFKQEGLRGFTTGTSHTFIRESVGCSIYYGVYEACKQVFPYQGTNLENFTYGAITGWISFMAMHPVDVVKTRMQAYKEPALKVWKEVAAQGHRGLWRGCLPMSLRIVPCSAIMFMTYEKTLTYFVQEE